MRHKPSWHDDFEELRILLSRDLGVDETDIKHSDVLGFTSWWDSLSHLGVLLVLERHYGIKIDADAVADLFTMERLLEVIRSQKRRAEQR